MKIPGRSLNSLETLASDYKLSRLKKNRTKESSVWNDPFKSAYKMRKVTNPFLDRLRSKDFASERLGLVKLDANFSTDK